jgi:hypothetical protein
MLIARTILFERKRFDRKALSRRLCGAAHAAPAEPSRIRRNVGFGSRALRPDGVAPSGA